MALYITNGSARQLALLNGYFISVADAAETQLAKLSVLCVALPEQSLLVNKAFLAPLFHTMNVSLVHRNIYSALTTAKVTVGINLSSRYSRSLDASRSSSVRVR